MKSQQTKFFLNVYFPTNLQHYRNFTRLIAGCSQGRSGNRTPGPSIQPWWPFYLWPSGTTCERSWPGHFWRRTRRRGWAVSSILPGWSGVFFSRSSVGSSVGTPHAGWPRRRSWWRRSSRRRGRMPGRRRSGISPAFQTWLLKRVWLMISFAILQKH